MKIGDSLILDGKQNIARINLNKDLDIRSKTKTEEKIFSIEMRKALNWLKEMYANGESWNLLVPSRDELRPNMKNKEDYPWHDVKSVLAKQQELFSDRPGFSHEDSIAISQKRKTVEEHVSEIKTRKRGDQWKS